MTASTTKRPSMEVLAAIESPSFIAGIVLRDDMVVEADSNLQHLKGWTRSGVIQLCWQKGWRFYTFAARRIGG